MANTPVVTVGAPDDLGLRKVMIGGRTVDRVRCPRELQRLLRRVGLASGYDIEWLGVDGTVWPDRPWRRRTIGALMAVGLVAADCVLIRIGVVDSTNSLTYAGRITGAIFIFLALVELVAAFATLDYWRKRKMKYSGAVILFGVLVALSVGLLLLAVQVHGRVVNGRLLLWVALVFWSSWALWILVRGQAWKGIRNPRRIAIGATASALLAIANLTYSQVYVPYTTDPLVQSGAEFETPSMNREGTVMYLPVHLYVKNSGKISVYILGSIFWIHGRDERATYDLINSGDFVTPLGRALNPGEEVAQDAVVEIKNPEKSKYDAVRVQTEVYVIRRDRVRMGAGYDRSGEHAWRLKEQHKDKDPQGPDGEYLRYQSDISNSDEILNLTRGRQRVTLWRVDDREKPAIYVNVAPPGERKGFDSYDIHANQDAVDRYGLEDVRGSMAQTPFTELLGRAQAERPTQ
ncbi:Yip1 family protein [Streptomyces sp. NPDC085866]|uniref:Yip1 family protein n=1 Tax=Streptomyces sp. NPDC085866 TaxID=3365736 RepID=UPI0037D30BB8